MSKNTTLIAFVGALVAIEGTGYGAGGMIATTAYFAIALLFVYIAFKEMNDDE